jgi:phosphoribosylformylglycinamidine (FGAM) synthase-like enzyme
MAAAATRVKTLACMRRKAVGEELCPALGLTIPVGKDSMSMKTRWQEGSEQREMTSAVAGDLRLRPCRRCPSYRHAAALDGR